MSSTQYAVALIGLSACFCYAAPSAAAVPLTAAPQVNVSLSPAEGWHIQFGAPVFWAGEGALPTLGVHADRRFALGQALGWSGGAERIGFGLGFSAFAPVHFQQLSLGASAGLYHYTPIVEGLMLDYGLRYAPLVAIDWAANTSTGYNGVFANIGLHLRLARNSWLLLGLQGGAYAAFTRPDAPPLWMLQPIFGINTSF